jgi:hypothetical protein
MRQANICAKLRAICIIWILSTSTLNLTAQFNLKIGYNASFPSLSTTNELLAGFQVPNQEIVESFKKLSFMHGIQLGLRYRLGDVAFVAGWERISRDRSALSLATLSEAFTTRTYDFSFSGFHGGFESYYGSFGFGSTLHSTRYKVSRQVSTNNLILLNDTKWNLRLKLIWVLQESNLVSVSIQPYYQFGLSDYDISAFATDISGENVNQLESPRFLGISFVFYNGRQ